MNTKLSKFSTTEADKIYEGLRVPSTLDGTLAVNFVITQEPGKLKPKDLKQAIERNRAEKELRAEEQKKIREEGGGAGLLDLRGILAEERQNANDGDLFKRQLRELAFLADVEEVEKQETEKSFRVSEDFVGSPLLSEEDIAAIYDQRARARLHKQRTEWRNIQGRQHTLRFAPNHAHVKAGVSADTGREMLSSLAPTFDPNRNDIWAKRLNTLRRFIACVGRWLVQRRVQDRMGRLLQIFHANNAFTREEVLLFIEQENVQNKKQGNSPGGNGGNSPRASSLLAKRIEENELLLTVATMVFEQPNKFLAKRLRDEQMLAESSITAIGRDSFFAPEMVRRVLFPQCNPRNGGRGNRKEIDPIDVNLPLNFDDRTVFQLKVRPDYITLGYVPHKLPKMPLYLPPCEKMSYRQGAHEERTQRPAADLFSTKEEETDSLRKWKVDAPPEPPLLGEFRFQQTERKSEEEGEVVVAEEKKDKGKDGNEDGDEMMLPPAWLPSGALLETRVGNGVCAAGSTAWSKEAINYFDAKPEMRVYGPVPRRCERDADWMFRPDNPMRLRYSPDETLRTSWINRSGALLSTNVYLLASQESSSVDHPAPPVGPTLVDFYFPDGDRHASGLVGCNGEDHKRGAIERDPEMGDLQTRQNRDDYLTDSESDNEDEYAVGRPTMAKVRAILHPPKSREAVEAEEAAAAAAAAGKKKDPKKKGKESAAAAQTAKISPRGAADAMDSPAAHSGTGTAEGGDRDLDALSVLQEDQRKEEQVELLRDRKYLELESTLLKIRKQKFDAVNEKLSSISALSRCSLQALPVQMPFHSYEDDVYKLLSARIAAASPATGSAEVSQSFVQTDPRAAPLRSSMNDESFFELGSPGKSVN